MDFEIQHAIQRLSGVIDDSRIRISEPMSRHTTFRIGGPADLFLTPEDRDELREVLKCLREEKIPCFILGNGSNLLVSDQGYRGAVIQIGKQMNRISIDSNRVVADAGALLSAIAAAAAGEKLRGFEFAGGIPGALGGACVMNAGAYGGEMKDVLKSVTVLNEQLEFQELVSEDLRLGYRTSIIKDAGYTVVEAVLELMPGDESEIRGLMKDLSARRIEKQPLEYPSAGSTFKRPEGYFAGKLIMDSGLRGYTVGGAQVSEKHCGFVVNRGGATAADVRQLIRDVIYRVEQTSGVTLEPEVKFLGEFEEEKS